MLQCAAVCCRVLRFRLSNTITNSIPPKPVYTKSQHVLRCVAVRCSVMQCVAACCNVLQWCDVCCDFDCQIQSQMAYLQRHCTPTVCAAGCCSVLQCVAERYSILQQSATVCCSIRFLPAEPVRTNSLPGGGVGIRATALTRLLTKKKKIFQRKVAK